MKNAVTTVFILFLGLVIVRAQETFPVNDVKDVRTGAFAFTNATIYVDYQNKLENATLLVKDGKVVNAGTGIPVPAGYTTINLSGKYVYPSLIDMYTTYGIAEPKRDRSSPWGRAEQIQSDIKGAYNANEGIKSHYNASEEFHVDNKEAKTLRNMGFGSVLTFRNDGFARGSSAVVTLGEDSDNKVMLNARAGAHYSFDRGTSSQYYPRSAMGYIALLRQTYMDAEWYASHRVKPFTDKSLDSWLALQNLPQVFETNSWLSLLRADKLGDEFNVQYIIKGGGDEYKRIADIKATNASLIIPVDYPTAPKVDDPFDANRVTLAEMKHWELAPSNLAHIERNNISFALTTSDLKKKTDFWPNLRKAIKNGLTKESALKALTHTPANLMRMGNRIGALKGGFEANFLITSGDLFDEKVIIYENWIQGKPYKIKDLDVKNLGGEYTLALNGSSYNLSISGEPGKHSAKIVINDSTDVKVKLAAEGNMVNMSFNPDKESKDGDYRLSGWLEGQNLKGSGQSPGGDWLAWSATFKERKEGEEKSDKKGGDQKEETLGDIIYPFMAYGSKEIPVQETLLIKNATVWTNEAEGILTETDVLLKDGKISRVGKDLSDRNARVIDGTGKHLTSGVIDEHSHLAASSINDVATNSSMVRISDVVNSENIGIYRALAGGVTALQILHGSANPIGGQSAHIKLRWGASPEKMKVENSDRFIKFALGENVKRASSNSSIRYPQTRMGVEQVYVDAFTAALDYEKEWNAYNRLSSRDKVNAQKPRRDLAMDAMVDIIRGRLFITCHSYVQSEINMLMKVAERFGFKVNTFTHILEGYKVADKMAEHGVGGSTFADWWVYKWEVRYAIPYNPTLMHKEGVVTVINSDSGEMIRRLNQEAAKSVKYGGMSEEDAWKMVTLNPAKLMHWDDRMGSIKVGKDADVVLWSDNPLSIYAKAEKTIVDGVVYFDIEKDKKMREEVKAERARLIAKISSTKSSGSGGSMRRGMPGLNTDFHCEDVVDYVDVKLDR